MIREEEKELVNKHLLYKELAARFKGRGAILATTLTLGQVLDVIDSIPTQKELETEWIREVDGWRCGFCGIRHPNFYGFRYCPYCGRRIINKGE